MCVILPHTLEFKIKKKKVNRFSLGQESGSGFVRWLWNSVSHEISFFYQDFNHLKELENLFLDQ